ncbi:SRPBCC family protein [Halopiger goleimassiliensis]|uniref:SRPBCC family protein n=1 Tax=Halopiger goleimassiliensis TaxID=1293048 RepID=UPI0006780B8B|nr:SRPBCC family protein [Halopiger goleimassiliensis]
MTRLRRTRTAAGRRLEGSQIVDVPADAAWDLFVDTTRWPEWSPIVSGVDASDRYVREGTTGRIRIPGAWVPFTVTDCRDRRWEWRVTGLPGSGHRVDDLGPERCRIVFELPTHAVGCAPICLEGLERMASILVEER